MTRPQSTRRSVRTLALVVAAGRAVIPPVARAYRLVMPGRAHAGIIGGGDGCPHQGTKQVAT